MNMLKKKRFWFGLFITAVFLYLVFRQIDLNGLATALAGASYGWLVPAFIVYLLGYGCRVMRWHYLIHAVKSIPWQRLFPPLILGFMFNNILPARAGEFVRAYVVGKRESISKSASFATVIMERAFDGLVMVLFAGAVLYFYRIPQTHDNAEFVNMVNLVVKITSVLFIVVFIGLFIILAWKQNAKFILGKITGRLPEKLRTPARKIFGSLLEGFSVLKSRRDSMMAFFLSVLAWCGESAAYYFVLRAFGLDLPVYVAVMLMAVVNLGIMIPSSPGYVGPFEFFGVGTLMLFQIPKSTALPCILIIHTLVWLPITVWGFYYMWTMKLSFREMEDKSQEKDKESAEKK